MNIGNFQVFQVQRAVIQILESIYLVENSRKPEIVVGRFNFLVDTAKILESCKTEMNYKEVTQEGIQLYKNAYPDRNPTPMALAIIEYVTNAFYIELYCVSLFNVLGRLFKEFVEATVTLKNESAKEKRKAVLLEKLKEIKSEIELKCKEANSYEKILQATNNLETIIRTRVSFDNLTFGNE